jgi:hypothetical protein
VADRIRDSADKYIELRKEYGLEQMRRAIEVIFKMWWWWCL